MRVAVISDLHGNSVALEHVLQEIAESDIDQIVCLGDVATLGPDPMAVIHRLQELGCPCILGNHDDFMLNVAKVREYTKVQVVVDAVEWCQRRMTKSELSFFKTFKDHHEIKAGKIRLRFFHGSPASHSEDIVPHMSPLKLDQLIGRTEGDVLVFGHTHLQMLVQHQGRYLLNPGSVGSPFKELFFNDAPTIFPHAEYAVIEVQGDRIEISLKRTVPDRQKLVEAVKKSDYPLKDFLLAQYAKA